MEKTIASILGALFVYWLITLRWPARETAETYLRRVERTATARPSWFADGERDPGPPVAELEPYAGQLPPMERRRAAEILAEKIVCEYSFSNSVRAGALKLLGSEARPAISRRMRSSGDLPHCAMRDYMDETDMREFTPGFIRALSSGPVAERIEALKFLLPRCGNDARIAETLVHLAAESEPCSAEKLPNRDTARDCLSVHEVILEHAVSCTRAQQRKRQGAPELHQPWNGGRLGHIARRKQPR